MRFSLSRDPCTIPIMRPRYPFPGTPCTEVSPQHSKITVRNNITIHPQSILPPPHLRQRRPRAPRAQHPPPSMITSSAFMSHLTPANQQLFIRKHSPSETENTQRDSPWQLVVQFNHIVAGDRRFTLRGIPVMLRKQSIARNTFPIALLLIC